MRSKFYTNLKLDQMIYIIYLYEAGFTVEEISFQLKISKKKIRHIINEAMGGDNE